MQLEEAKNLGLKELRTYLKADTWLLVISLFSVFDLSSILVYKQQIINSYEVYKTNYHLIVFVFFLFYAGWKIIPSALRFLFMLIFAVLLNLDFYNNYLSASYNSTERIRNAKKYALLNKNSLILDIFLKAESVAKKREYTAKLYVWNYFLFGLMTIIPFTIDTNIYELPFFTEILITAKTFLFKLQGSFFTSMIDIACSLVVIGIFLNTFSEVVSYLQYDDFIFISIDEMSIIEKVIDEDAKLKDQHDKISPPKDIAREDNDLSGVLRDSKGSF